jgi:hypothetical protein
MTSRRAALGLVALALGGIAAGACSRSGSSAPTAAPTSVVVTRVTEHEMVTETLADADAVRLRALSGSSTDFEELIEDDPDVASDDPATTDTTATDETTDSTNDSSTTTTEPKPVTISTKREPTGPGVPAIPTYTQSAQEIEYFACVTQRESGNNPHVVNLSSGAAGLFQFLQSTWDIVARRVGRGDLVGVNPALASVATQRYFAHVLFQWQGAAPWASDGCGVPGLPGTTTTTTPGESTTSSTFPTDTTIIDDSTSTEATSTTPTTAATR